MEEYLFRLDGESGEGAGISGVGLFFLGFEDFAFC
jgi:hypothetical protein